MIEKEILECNKLIAEFDAFKYINDDSIAYPNGYMYCADIGAIELKDMQYHSSWDWLMPVVEKIEAMGCDVGITKARCEIKDNVNLQDGYYGFEHLNTKIEAVYAAVIEFIKHYNATK